MIRRRKKFEGMSNAEKARAMNPQARARFKAQLERQRAHWRGADSLAKAAVESARLRNSPIDREEVSIYPNYEIRTLPASAVQLDPAHQWPEPRVIKHLVEPLVDELTKVWEDEGGKSGIKIYMRVSDVSKHYAVKLVQEWEKRKPHMPRPEAARQCKACGQLFFYTSGHSRMRFCSDACIAVGQQAVVADYVRSRAVVREHGRLTKCAQCGGPMPSARSTRKYCSGACRVAAHRATERPPIDLNELDLK